MPCSALFVHHTLVLSALKVHVNGTSSTFPRVPDSSPQRAFWDPCTPSSLSVSSLSAAYAFPYINVKQCVYLFSSGWTFQFSSVWGITNNASINILVHDCGHTLSSLESKYLSVELLGNRYRSNYTRPSQMVFPKWWCSAPTSNVGEFQSLHVLANNTYGQSL